MMTVDPKNVMDQTKKVENVTGFLKSSFAGGKPDVKNVLSKVSVSYIHIHSRPENLKKSKPKNS